MNKLGTSLVICALIAAITALVISEHTDTDTLLWVFIFCGIFLL